jgi:hypothetical protein
MSNEKKDLVGLAFGILTSPQATFPKINEEDLMKGFLLIGILAVMTAVSTATYMRKIPIEVLIPQIGQTEADSLGNTQNIFTIIWIANVIVTLIGYVFPVIIIHGAVTLTGGQGSLKKGFTMNAFASIPLLIQQLLRIFDSIIISSNSLTSYLLFKRAITRKLIITIIDTKLLTLFGLATWYLIGYGVSVNYGISRRKSLLLALLPYILFFALNYYLSG